MRGGKIMKYRDLISQVVREDMPDLEQVRENCHRLAIPQKPIVRKLRWSVAAAMAACFALVTVVYAASVIIQRFDTGGTTQFISVDYDSPQLQAQMEGMIPIRQIYVNSRADISPRFMQFNPQEFEGFEGFGHEEAMLINEILAGQIFTADGEPFVLMTAIPNQNAYQADSRGNILFDTDGHEIGTVRIGTTWDGEIVWSEVVTLAEFEESFRFAALFQDGVELLGQHFQLPTVHMERFDPPVFRLYNWTDSITGQDVRRITVRYMEGDIFANDLIITIETVSDESTEPLGTWYTTAEITENEIAGITITKMAFSNYTFSFYWIFEGLVYSLNPPSAVFTERQLEEIIRSMLIPHYASDEYLQYEQLGTRHFSGRDAIQRALEVDGLVAVRGIGFNEGWAYARELHLFWDMPTNNPEEALAYMQALEHFANEHGNIRYVNVYDFDGETVVDMFRMYVVGGTIFEQPLLP